MATRFYLSGTAFTVMNPGVIGTWGSTSNMTRKKLVATTPPDDDSFTTINISVTGAFTSVHRQYISEPMDSGIVFNSSTTFKFCIKCGESSTSANTFHRFHVAIVSEDGATVRAQFTAGEKDSNEFPVTDASRCNERAGSSGISYTTVSGDRLVVEHGFDKDATGTYTISFQYGNTAANDLSETDGDTGTDNPWFETSATVTFDGDAPPEDPPPAENEDFGMTTFISGVLDEFV